MSISFKLRNLPTRMRGWKAELYHAAGIGLDAELRAVVIRRDGTRDDLGVVSRRLVTDNGVAFMVDALQNLTEMENLNWHDAGTGTGAEAASDSALGTPWGGARVNQWPVPAGA